MRYLSKLFLVLVALSGLLLGRTASAGSITIVNPGFESVQVSSSNATPVILSNLSYTDFGIGSGSTLYTFNGSNYIASGNVFVPGWIGNGNTGNGTGNSGVANYIGFGAISGESGQNVAYANSVPSGPNTFSQTLSSVLQAGTYVLSVMVGERSDFPAGSAIVALNNAGVATSSSSPSLVPGGFVTYSQTYTIGASDPNLGQVLGITLGNATVNDQGYQTLFDDVKLDFTPSASAVPLPSAAWSGMALFGALGLTKMHRRFLAQS